ncbi:MAG: chromate efflux transporter [Chloroflexi bacterium]|mgnify:FL=1|jgi:chromate transporter|nr:chromate efflux transporter [Anaerolineaceae bacterium]NLI44712.1 chromate efflux transporter [Chloroflexota bacterium]HOE34961.1 chromate efflux transporter [Anaerolineaceae bacterium]HOT25500.1 chromate efflux transporter [Anaerolineaceae bacterium]HQH58144.1 chromate efflux transporter [Anaerolineaceae bacterium]
MKLEIPTLPLEQKARLKDLIKVFLQIGATSFGSPTAHIAMMESEIVRKRKWLTGEHFLELLAATHLVPGPNATELALHIGYLEAGFPGLLAAGASFILPSFIATVSFAWAYTRYGALPQVDAIFYALNPLVLAIVINTLWSLGKSCLKTWQTWLIFGLAFGASLLGVNEVIILFAAGLLGYVLVYLLKHPPKAPAALLAVFPFPLLLRLFQQGPDWLHSRVAQLFLYFLRTGAVLFGSALVLFPLIRDDIVNRFGWMTQQQLVDAIAVGQMTPGPVTSAVTFIGYMVGGIPGAFASTIGVFLPSFIVVTAMGPLMKKLANSPVAQAVLEGVNAGVVALIITIAVTMAKNAVVDVWTALLLAAGLAGLFLLKLTPYWLVLAGIMIGLAKALLF